MRVSDEVRQCVAFVGLKERDADGKDVLRLKGTAFFVSIASETVENWGYRYLVTAKHVAEVLEGRQFFVRLNTKSGQSHLVWSDGSRDWWNHPTDPLVDVAAFPWVPPQHVEYTSVSSEMFLTGEVMEEKKIGAGDEVFMTGLFAYMAGSARNLPIVRMGNIAMMPPEPVPTIEGNIDAYLIEARSIGGLSGSPAFVRETRDVGIGPFYLLGLMKGHWDIPPGNKNDQASEDVIDALGAVNMGIAIVVPAKKILEVLNHPELVAGRTKADEKEAAKREQATPTSDAATKADTA